MSELPSTSMKNMVTASVQRIVSDEVITISSTDSESDTDDWCDCSSDSNTEEYDFVLENCYRFFNRLNTPDTNDVQVLLNISELRPHIKSWLIQVHVLDKSPIMKSENGLPSFRLILKDETGEIRATITSAICEQYYDYIDTDKVYYFSKCSLLPSRCTTIIKNEYEVDVIGETIVQPCKDTSIFRVMEYNFVPTFEITTLADETIVDVIGICRNVGILDATPEPIPWMDTTIRSYRNIQISGLNLEGFVTVTLWGPLAETFNDTSNSIILISRALVKDKNLILVPDSIFKINPFFQKAKFYDWLTLTSIESKNSIPLKNFHEVDILNNENPIDTFKCIACIEEFKCGTIYRSCVTSQCYSRVRRRGDKYFCDKCNSLSPTFTYRLMIDMLLCDSATSRWVTCPTEITETLLGISAPRLRDAMELFPIEEAAVKFFNELIKTNFLFTIKDSMNHYGDPPNQKTIVINVQSVKPEDHTPELINRIIKKNA